ncbi:MAG: hypothetical protein AB8B69_10665 [Chitinophagales bacterium]
MKTLSTVADFDNGWSDIILLRKKPQDFNRNLRAFGCVFAYEKSNYSAGLKLS